MNRYDLTFGMSLKSVHRLDAGTHVELKFKISPSINVDGGGSLILLLTPEDVRRDGYMLGDQLFAHLRGV